jgi:S-DNA-T family DNA segregation ATPase FtsK/SpoIIIE
MAAKKNPPKAGGGKFLPRTPAGDRDRRAARWARIKEAIGVALVALTVAGIISLISYHPQDASFNAASSTTAYHNYLGRFGAYLSDILIQLLGFGAYLFPLFTFVLSLACFVRIAEGHLHAAARFGGAILFSLSLVGLANLLFPSDPLFADTAAGGLAGDFLVRHIAGYLGRAGAYLVFFSALIVSLMALTSLTLKETVAATGVTVTGAWNRFRQQRQLTKGRAVKEKKARKGPAKEPVWDVAGEPEIIDHLAPPPPRKTRRPAKQETLDFRKGAGKFTLPSLSLLDDPPVSRSLLSREELIANSRILEGKLKDFGVTGKVTQVHPGPVITMYEFSPAPGVKVNRIVNLADDLALAMSAMAVRVVAPIPGKSVVGIEIPNHAREVVHLKDIMVSDEFRATESKLSIALGKNIFGRPRTADLGTMPHVLIAGATGAGKSVMINSIICSILFNATPAEVLFLMIDPKMVELTTYDGIPHLIAPVVSNPKKAAYALRNAVGIMEERYRILSEKKVRNIASYNKLISSGGAVTENGEPEPSLMPYLVIVIDELADLMILAQNEVEDSITRLAQLSRAVGIHLVIATQRPSTNVITGIIKANLPVRISFQVSSKIDSRVILDTNGAEQLLGKGDLLFLPPGTNKVERAHGAFVSEEDVNRLTEHLKRQAQPSYDESILKAPAAEEAAESEGGEEDEMYDQAVELVTKTGQASISFLQRRLRVGYNRAARMIEAMEQAGLLGPADGARPRKILARRDYDE